MTGPFQAIASLALKFEFSLNGLDIGRVIIPNRVDLLGNRVEDQIGYRFSLQDCVYRILVVIIGVPERHPASLRP